MEQVTYELSRRQIDFYARLGYLALEALTDPDDVAMLREAYDRIFAQRAGRAEGNEFDLAGTDGDGEDASLPQILDPARYAPELNSSRLLANATRVARQLLGPEAHCGFAHAILKPAHHGAETPWHQDASYWPADRVHHSLSIWVPLQEATLDNGCMEFIPGSHHLDVVPHQSIGNDPRVHGNELRADELWRAADAVACPLPPGGATIHTGYTLHHTGPNGSDGPRRALILGADVPSTPRDVPLSMPWMDEKRTARLERAKAAADVR